MIHLHGYLADKYGKDHNIIVKSAGEAIRALQANYKGFANAIKRDMYYSVVRGKELNKGKDLSEEELSMNFNENHWHIIPVPDGAKNGGFFQLILGVALIAVGLFAPGISEVASGILFKIGGALALGGLSQMMAPSPITPDYGNRERPEERASYLFNGAKNRTEQGDAIPVAYGETFIGSIVISGGIDVGDTA